MSTLSGIASKGEKGRSKFHSLDINYLYRGESLEPHQQKNIAHQRKHGMQTLGKVPATRRAPANLPSLKSEHSGNDPAYSLVPTGGTGWGSKPGETGPPPSSTTCTTPTTATTTQSTATIPAQSTAAPLSVPASGSSTPTTTTTTPVQQPPQQQPTTGTTSHVHDKSWSAIMSNSSNEAVPNFLAHQSPSFQQEFPSLFGETTNTSGTTVKSDNQYGPGPSLRPQTEGSWSQGGSRPQAPIGGTAGSQTVTAPAQGPLHLPPGPEMGGIRSSLGPSGVGGGPAGPPHQTPHMLPAHFKGVMPPFMFRPNYPGGFPQNFQGPVHGPTRPRFPYMPDRVMGAPRAAAASSGDPEEMTPRPIIKEEDLNRMDDVARDVGWATHDDIDYNQKLAFSDDENGQDDESNNTRSGRDAKGTRSPPHQQNRDREQPIVVDRERDTDSGDRDDRASSREKLSMADGRSWQTRAPTSLMSSFGSQGMRPQQGNRGVEDEDFWREKRRQTNEGVAIAIERAKQRKEEEEKRFEESKQAAKRKLQEIDEKRKNKQQGQTQGSNDCASASNLDTKDLVGGHQHQDEQANHNTNMSLPEWEREKDKDNNDGKEQISTAPVAAPPATNQLDNRRDLNFRDRERDRDHDRDRDRDRERQRDRDMRGEREQSVNVQQLSVGGGGTGGGQSGGGSSHYKAKANIAPRFLRQHQQKQHQQQQHQQQQHQQQHGDQQRSGFFYKQNSAGSPQPLPWSVGSNSGSGGPNANHIPGGVNRSSGVHRNRTDSEVSDRERDDDLRGGPKSDRRDRHTPDGYDRERSERYRSRGGPESSASSTSSSGGGNRLGGLLGGPYDGRGKGPPSSTGPGCYNGTSDYNRGYNRDYNRMDKGSDREREMESESDRHDRDSHYFDERENEGDLKKLHDTFDGRDRDSREPDWRESNDRRNERDRPQRPDSRDSRTSRDSRNSRDSMRDETKSITESLLHDRSSWADSPYDPDIREEKMRRDDRRETSSGRNPPYMQQRHIPGPITREKLEASEQRNEAKRNLIPLVRSDKKTESLKKTDSQMDKVERKLTNDNENTSDVWSRNSNVTSVSSPTPLIPLESESWADATEEVLLKPSQSLAPTSGTAGDKHVNTKTELDDTQNTTESQPQQQLPQSLPSPSPPPSSPPPAQLPDEQTLQSSQKVSSIDNTDPSVKKSDESDIVGRPEKSGGGRGGRGGRSNDGRSKEPWGNTTVYNRAGGYGSRGGESRGRRGSGRGVPRSHSARGCVHSESEVSGDEISVSASISTESGKEEKRDRRDDRRITPRSPKQGSRKSDRDDRNHDPRRDGEKNYPSGSDGRRYDKRSSYDNSRNNAGSGGSREGFAPRGEPSRRGRGGFRTRGATRVNTGSNYVYGVPPRKPFLSTDSAGKLDYKEKNLQAQSSSKESEHNADAMSSADDKMKLSQQALSAGIIGGRQNSKSSNVPPRLQRKSESEKRERRKSREGRGRARHLQHQTHHGDPQQQGQTQRTDQGEDWETTSENSEGDDRDDNKHRDDNSRRRNYHSSRHPTSTGRTGRRNNPSSTARGGGEKRSYERKERHSGSGPPGGNGGNSQQMNGSGRQGLGGPGKNKEINAGDNKSGDQHGLNRNEKDKANNLDGLDLTNIASVVIIDDQPEGSLEEDRSVFAADSGGFKEVRSKKNMKQQQGQKLVDDKSSSSLRGGSGGNKDRNKSGPMKNSSVNNQPPGSATVTSVCGGMQTNSQSSSKNYNSRPKKLPPRFERQKEKQKANLQQHQQQQVQQQYDVAEMNKLNHGVTLFPIKDMPPPTATQNAWEKPIAPSLRNSSNSSPPSAMQLTSTLTNSTDNSCSGGGAASTGVDAQDPPQSGASSQRSSPTSNEKLVNKIGRETMEKAVLDGTTPPVQTIIFENTNYKSTPGDQIQAMKNKFKNQKMDRNRGGERKVESMEDNSHTIGLSGYKPSGTDIKGQENKSDPIQMPISFGKSEDSADMKLDFFDTELLTDDKSSKSISIQRSLNTVQNSAADLNFKIASVKKVWDQPPLGTGSVMEHHTEDTNVVSTSSSFTPTFGNAVEDPTSYVKPVDHSSVVQGEDGTSLNAGEIVYNATGQCQTVPVPGGAGSYVSAVPNMMKPDAASSASSNVCKLLDPQVKPQPAAAMPSTHSVQLSPPPYNSSSAQPGGHINYQATAQFNSMSAIPSPPTVLYNTHANQQIPAQGDIYQTAFQLSNTTPVLSGQARSQFTQFAGPYVGSLSSTNAFSQQSMYLHQTPTHPPSAPPACPELYQTTLSQYRIAAPPAAFGQSQQLNSNSPMLISSSANSHMSPTVVKPASQQIGAIGSKAPPYQASAPSQMYMYPDPNMLSQNYLSNSQLIQQRPASNVVPQQLQQSSSFYSAPAGSQTGGFFNPASSNLPSAAQPLHQTQFGMPYGNTQSPANLQNYGSQYRQPGPGPGGPNPSYLKSSNITQQHVTDPAKSPSTNQPDVMNSVFSASQIPSPKSRTAGGAGGGSGPTKHPGQQPSPPQSHHKFSSYQTLPQALQQQQQAVQRGGQMSVTMVRGNVAGQTTRYPAPIQRPVPYQTLQQQTTNNSGNNNNNAANNTGHNGNNNNQGRHRQNTRIPPTSTQALINKMPPSPATSPYYSAGQAGGGGGSVNVKLDGPNTNNNAVSNSTSGLESKNENICKVNDNSNATNKQQAVTADSSKDPHDGHNTSATND